MKYSFVLSGVIYVHGKSFGKKFRLKKKKKKVSVQKKKKKKPAILCLHDGSPDDRSAPQLIKRLGFVLSCLYDWVYIKEHVWTVGTCPTTILLSTVTMCMSVCMNGSTEGDCKINCTVLYCKDISYCLSYYY